MLNVSKIDERIRKLQELRRLASDPEMLHLLRELVDDSANRNESAAEAPAPSAAVAPVAITREPRMRRPRKGALIKTASRVVDTLAGEYDFHAVMDRMREVGFQFAGKPEVAVNGVLRKLLKRKRIVLVEEGVGRTPNKYRTVAPS
jgi:hypothetical protein